MDKVNGYVTSRDEVLAMKKSGFGKNEYFIEFLERDVDTSIFYCELRQILADIEVNMKRDTNVPEDASPKNKPSYTGSVHNV